MPNLPLTDRAVAALPYQSGTQVDFRDAEVAGFFVRVGARSKTYMIEADLRIGDARQRVRMKIGSAGALSARDARSKAKALLGQIQDGIDPRPRPEPPPVPVSLARNPTLRSAWASYLESHLQRKNRSQNTIDDYQDHVERLMMSWLDRPLRELGEDPLLVKEMHDRITVENGPYMANSCMRTFRAVYTHARKTALKLPAENPVFAVDWNPEKRRDSGMGPEDLRGWYRQARALDNPLRRELHLLILLSGSRSDAIKKIEIKHIDLARRVIFLPRPKGGEEKAFCIQLSRQMVRCIVRAMRFGRMMHPREAETWLFPAESYSGHISEHKEDRSRLSHWGNGLRETYRTMAQVAGTGDIDIHLLMNHSLPGVNAGYITRSKLNTHLRNAQQILSDILLEEDCDALDTTAVWPRASGRALIAAELPARLDMARGRGGQRCSRNMAVFRDQGDALSSQNAGS